MCSVIDKTLFTLKRADNFDNQYAVHGHAGCGCTANKIVVIFYFILYSVIIMTTSNSSWDSAY